VIIEPGKMYLLDGKIEVLVLKPLNRSRTIFSVEIPNKSIQSVEGSRLQDEKKTNAVDTTI
jgi:hypothetical protein